MRKGFREGIKPVSVAGVSISFRRGPLFATDIPRGKYFFYFICALKFIFFPRVAESRDFNYGAPVKKIIQRPKAKQIIILLINH